MRVYKMNNLILKYLLIFSLFGNTFLGFNYFIDQTQDNPKHTTSDIVKFLKKAYEKPPVNPKDIASSFILNDPQKIFFSTAPQVSLDSQGLEEALTWYLNNLEGIKQNFKGFYGTPTHKDTLFCDQNVSIFRSFLNLLGFKSRVMVFEFNDGKGGASHTFTEVWLDGLMKWVYVDSHYGIIAPKNAMSDVITNQSLIKEINPINSNINITTRDDYLSDMFKNGWLNWYVIDETVHHIKFEAEL
jgi:hypothetical protein